MSPLPLPSVIVLAPFDYYADGLGDIFGSFVAHFLFDIYLLLTFYYSADSDIVGMSPTNSIPTLIAGELRTKAF